MDDAFDLALTRSSLNGLGFLESRDPSSGLFQIICSYLFCNSWNLNMLRL